MGPRCGICHGSQYEACVCYLTRGPIDAEREHCNRVGDATYDADTHESPDAHRKRTRFVILQERADARREAQAALAVFQAKYHRLEEAARRLHAAIDPNHTECPHWRDEIIGAKSAVLAALSVAQPRQHVWKDYGPCGKTCQFCGVDSQDGGAMACFGKP